MVALALLALCAFVAAPTTASAQGLLKETIGDWQYRCDTPPGAPSEQCALVQSVTAEDRQNVGLTVVILQTADKKDTILRVLAPLGVLLPAGSASSSTTRRSATPPMRAASRPDASPRSSLMPSCWNASAAARTLSL